MLKTNQNYLDGSDTAANWPKSMKSVVEEIAVSYTHLVERYQERAVFGLDEHQDHSIVHLDKPENHCQQRLEQH